MNTLEMKHFAPAILAYAAYCAAVGGKTFDDRPLPTFEQLGDRQKDDRPLPTFEQLGDRQKDGWLAAANSCGSAFRPNQPVTITPLGIDGVVSSINMGVSSLRGCWVDCLDGIGRPFQHYALEIELEPLVEGEATGADL